MRFRHFVESGVDAGDYYLEGIRLDGAEVSGERVSGEVSCFAGVAGQPDPGGDRERGEVRDGPVAGEGADEADCAAAPDEGKRRRQRGGADELEGCVEPGGRELAHNVRERVVVEHGVIGTDLLEEVEPCLVARCRDDGGAASSGAPDASTGDASQPETSASDSATDASSEATVEPGVPMTGKLLDLAGVPIQGCKVASANSKATSAADGTFTVHVSPPYDTMSPET